MPTLLFPPICTNLGSTAVAAILSFFFFFFSQARSSVRGARGNILVSTDTEVSDSPGLLKKESEFGSAAKNSKLLNLKNRISFISILENQTVYIQCYLCHLNLNAHFCFVCVVDEY